MLNAVTFGMRAAVLALAGMAAFVSSADEPS